MGLENKNAFGILLVSEGIVALPAAVGNFGAGNSHTCWCPWLHHPHTPSADEDSSPEQH